MRAPTVLVLTSVAPPTPRLQALAAGARAHRWGFVLVGDETSPAGFALDGCEYYDLARQRALPLATAELCPTRSYARKNVGYLIAMARGAEVIVETDDDSVPAATFWRTRERRRPAHLVVERGWVNVYRYFADAPIWPRGFPLDAVRILPPRLEPARRLDAPIQQGLVDADPDVDAVYRLTGELPFRFAAGPSVGLGPGAWCPFNSQNTTWWRDAFPLMYLPATCSFRLTDIWRSFVAQRIAWANGWTVLFHRATVRQDRNEHDLMGDFRDEIDGYLANRTICAALDALDLERGAEHLGANMRTAYRCLVDGGWIGELELALLDAWLEDVAALTALQAPLVARAR